MKLPLLTYLDQLEATARNAGDASPVFATRATLALVAKLRDAATMVCRSAEADWKVSYWEMDEFLQIEVPE